MPEQVHNPYTDNGPIEKPNQFFNRKILAEKLLSLLFSESIQCLSLIGPRKSGKSSLIKHLARPGTIVEFHHEGGKHLFVYINCAKRRDALKSGEDFYRLLLKSLYTEVSKTLQDAAKDYAVNLTNPSSWQDEWDQLSQELTENDFYIIVILDDFDTAIMQEHLMREGLFGSLHVYGSEPNFAWITCTFQPLPTLFKKAFDDFDIPEIKRRSESDFYNIFAGYRVVGLFNQEDIEELITKPARSAEVIFSCEEKQAIRRFGGRFPYFIQRACYHFFETHVKGEEKHEEVLQTCIQESQSLWQGYWDKLTSQQQRLLFSIASGHPVEISPDVLNLKDAALIYEDQGYWFPFSEEFGRFIRSREHPYMGLPVNQGDLLWKQYEVEAIAGRTLHSQVVRAQDIYLKRHWAIKLLCINQDHTDEQVLQLHENLIREAKILDSLDHEDIKNISKVHEVRIEPLAIIMPWVEGNSLQTILEEQPPLSLTTIIKIGMQLAKTLGHAHRCGVIHRDIKPNNIILQMTSDDDEPVPVLIDFDVARSKDQHTITFKGNGSPVQVGNKEYAAPEQFVDPNLVVPRSDIFALGVILYELITHERPYPYGHDPKYYADRFPTPEQQNIPDPLYQVLYKMLRQGQEQRLDANDVYDQLQLCLQELEGNGNDKKSK